MHLTCYPFLGQRGSFLKGRLHQLPCQGHLRGAPRLCEPLQGARNPRDQTGRPGKPNRVGNGQVILDRRFPSNCNGEPSERVPRRRGCPRGDFFSHAMKFGVSFQLCEHGAHLSCSQAWSRFWQTWTEMLPALPRS